MAAFDLSQPVWCQSAECDVYANDRSFIFLKLTPAPRLRNMLGTGELLHIQSCDTETRGYDLMINNDPQHASKKNNKTPVTCNAFPADQKPMLDHARYHRPAQ